MTDIRIGIPELKKYINREIPRLIEKDLLKHRIIREPDLECCVYHHLRKFLSKDKRWLVFAERHVKSTGRFVDLVIYRENKPIIAIELKINRENIGKKDLNSLRTSLKKLKVAKAYFIVANTLENREYRKKSTRTSLEHRYFKEIFIDHGLEGTKFQAWKEQQDIYEGQLVLRNVNR